MAYTTWVAISFLVGVLGYFAPAAIAPAMPKRMRRKAGQRYIGNAMGAALKALLVRKKLGGHSLVPTAYDPDKEAQKGEPEGEEAHFDDPYRFMKRCKNRPLGIAYGQYNAILTPMFGEIGEKFADWLEDDKHIIDLTGEDLAHADVDPQNTDRAFNRVMNLSETDRGVDMAEVTYIMRASTRPTDAETSYDYVKKSQMGFNTRRAVEAMAIMTSFAAGFGLVALAIYQFGSGGVSGVNLPMVLFSGVFGL